MVEVDSQYKNDIKINYNGKLANAKDILEIMLLGLTQGSWIELIIHGNDTPNNINALSNIETLINNYFGEGG